MADLLVLPDDDAYVVARADGATLEELWRAPIGPRPTFVPIEEQRELHHIQVHEEGWVSRADYGVRFYRPQGSTLERVCTVNPPDLEAHTVAMHRGAAYIGGTGRGERGKREVLFVSEGELGRGVRFRPVEVPDNLRWHDGKGIDAFVLDGDTLIAVDNVYEPLYFLLYDVSEPHQPRLVREVSFSHVANGDRVVTAILGPCLALLASSHWYMKITLYDRETLGEVATFHHGSYDRPESAWRTMVFSGDRLYVAAGTEGVGSIDVKRVREQQPWLVPPLDYVPSPSGGPVRFVTRGRGGLYLHTPGHGGVRSEWLVT